MYYRPLTKICAICIQYARIQKSIFEIIYMKEESSDFIQRMKLAAVNICESPWGAAIVSGLVYLLVSAYPSGRLFTQSYQPHYNYLADAFLHCQTWLRIIPPYIDDLSIFNGRFYLYWAPFPAIALMPFVAIFGVQLNDVLYTVLIAALNVGLVAQLLRAACQADFLHLSQKQRAILVFFFAFGTVHFMLAQYGRVWYTGQLIGFTCTLLAYLAAFSLRGGKAWFFTGLALAGAMLTRNQMVFTGIFPTIYLLLREKPWNWGRVIRNLALAAIPLVSALLFYLFYNQVRFGNPMDVGLAYIPYSGDYRADFLRYGFFNFHYIPNNLYYQYIFYPFPLRQESVQGGSLFLLSPLFFSVFAAFWNPRNKIFVWALLVSILITNIPILLCMGTGFAQFGPRYTLDFTVPLFLLTALGMEKWKPFVPLLLAIVSFIQYFIGVRALG
jgi:hypothetical protein